MQIECTLFLRNSGTMTRPEVHNTRQGVDQGVTKYRGDKTAVGWQLMVLEITLRKVEGAIHGTKGKVAWRG